MTQKQVEMRKEDSYILGLHGHFALPSQAFID